MFYTFVFRLAYSRIFSCYRYHGSRASPLGAPNTEDKQKIASLEAEVSRLKSAASSSSAETRLESFLVEFCFAKLSDDLTTKIGEFEEVKFRLSAMAPSFEKAQARVAQLNAEKNDLLARIASLEGQIAVLSGNQPRPSVSLSASSVMSTGSLPDSNASSGSGVISASTPKRVAFDSPVRYQNPPTVTTSADTISGVVPSSPVTYSLATSSAARISPGQSLFGKSAPAAAPSVSGSGEVRRDVNDDDGAGHNDSAGESRDSGSGMPVSSSDGRRKRTATNESSSCESKRHRDSPSEVVTSSEERRDLDVIPESGMVAAADMEVMDVPDDAEGDEDIEVLEEGQEDSIELLSDEDVSEQSMDDFDEDEDNSLDAPAHSGDFVDDEDREAASAVEEADDEGRTDTGNSGSAAPQTARLRIPIVYGAEDQCSSSNESGAAQFAARRRRPIGLYQPGIRHVAPSSAHQDVPAERMSARMRGRARAALRGRGKGRGAKH
ncbi:hypothetical protein TELCIR_07011 [Teladorsagia circumcincta]|uniref:Uncharacterized protein n=1 Tax=Teladorsagia circumcincta TaxID=45464 RepID=A0A2G9ULK7_TELCI|nr:hypothetical protein TELCIR_07011 [Teladorsagia circumcincta]